MFYSPKDIFCREKITKKSIRVDLAIQLREAKECQLFGLKIKRLRVMVPRLQQMLHKPLCIAF